MDLADGHVAAINYMKTKGSGYHLFNLGTGKGYSVLEMVTAMEKASGKTIATKIGERRTGDVTVCYADAEKAKKEMGWEAKLGLDEMCADAWRWQQQNPNGFN
jgi:UDP-glucose 4-epimerase